MFTSLSPLAYIVINIDPVALHLGPLAIRWYGLGYVLAISIALWATQRYADELGIPRQYVWNVFVGTAIAGLIGGRLYYVIQQPDLVQNYLLNPLNIIAAWKGGMAFFGAIFLAAPTAAYLARRYGLSPWIALDMAAFFGATGQMFGRLGNLINGDIVGYAAGQPAIPGNTCLHAPCIAFVSDSHILPWATVYLHPGSFVAQLGTAYQPAAFYEILINLAALSLLWPLRLRLPRQLQSGAFFCLYILCYAVGQFMVFFARANVFVPFLGINGLKQAQWTAIVTFLAGMALYWYVIRRFSAPWTHSPEDPIPPPPETAKSTATTASPSHP